MAKDLEELKIVARTLRADVVRMSHETGAPHLGSSLSCIDILTALYWRALRIEPAAPDNPLRDRLIFSKGHAAAALYAALCRRGFFSEDTLKTFAQPGGALAEHPLPHCVPGLEAAAGSLGHGLPTGTGMALAARILKQNYRVVVLMSDGECNEGSVWEAALLAPAQKLDNLTAIIDFNKWQATGRSCEVMALEPLRDKWAAFGWNAVEVDGHDIGALADVLSAPPVSGKPTAVIAHTVKGRGVSFMEDDNNWHYRIPTAEELAAARRELGLS